MRRIVTYFVSRSVKSDMEAERNSRRRDGCVRGVAVREVSRHGRRCRVACRLRDRLGDDGVGRVRARVADACEPGAVRAFALDDGLVRLRPHVHVRECDAGAGCAVGADELHGRTLHAVRYVSVPVLNQAEVSGVRGR